MKHHANPRFWKCYRGLPKEIQRLADRSYELLKSDPTHRSLYFKKIGQFWSARVGLHYRALAVEADKDLVWFWIGSHADYDKLVQHEARSRKPVQQARRKPPSKGDKGRKRG